MAVRRRFALLVIYSLIGGLVAFVPRGAIAAVPALPAAGSYFQIGTFVDTHNQAYMVDSNTVHRLGMWPIASGPTGAWHVVPSLGFKVMYRVRWGWITGTLYLNKRETALASSMAFVSFLAAFLPPPFNLYVAGEAAWISTTAGIVRYQNRCLEIKSSGAPIGYSGSWCR